MKIMKSMIKFQKIIWSLIIPIDLSENYYVSKQEMWLLNDFT